MKGAIVFQSTFSLVGCVLGAWYGHVDAHSLARPVTAMWCLSLKKVAVYLRRALEGHLHAVSSVSFKWSV